MVLRRKSVGEQDVADQQGAFAIKRRYFFSTFRFFAVLVFVRAGALCSLFSGDTRVCRRVSLKTTTKRIDFKNPVRYAVYG